MAPTAATSLTPMAHRTALPTIPMAVTAVTPASAHPAPTSLRRTPPISTPRASRSSTPPPVHMEHPPPTSLMPTARGKRSGSMREATAAPTRSMRQAVRVHIDRRQFLTASPLMTISPLPMHKARTTRSMATHPVIAVPTTTMLWLEHPVGPIIIRMAAAIFIATIPTAIITSKTMTP